VAEPAELGSLYQDSWLHIQSFTNFTTAHSVQARSQVLRFGEEKCIIRGAIFCFYDVFKMKLLCTTKFGGVPKKFAGHCPRMPPWLRAWLCHEVSRRKLFANLPSLLLEPEVTLFPPLSKIHDDRQVSE